MNETSRFGNKIIEYLRGILVAAALGALLGLLGKYADVTPANELPSWAQSLDLAQFLSRIGVWIFLGTFIAISAKSPLRAAFYNFSFFAAMVGTYFAYSNYVAGFYPTEYAKIWYLAVLFTPVFGAIAYFAKTWGPLGFAISALILGAMANTALSFGYYYLDVVHWPELILLGILIVLLRRGFLTTGPMLLTAIAAMVFLDAVVPFSFH